MNPFDQNRSPDGEAAERKAAGEDPAYPSTIKSMSEKWRSIREKAPDGEGKGFFERNFLFLGIGIALFIMALIIVIGGFAFLVWNAR